MRRRRSPGFTAWGRRAKLTEARVSLPTISSVVRVKGWPLASSMGSVSSSPIRILGPGRSASSAISRPAAAAAARSRSIRAACSSNLPWEKFNRATFSPARIMASNTSGTSEAGPMVATIRVLCEVSTDQAPSKRVLGWGGVSGVRFIRGSCSDTWASCTASARICGPFDSLAWGGPRRDPHAALRSPGSRVWPRAMETAQPVFASRRESTTIPPGGPRPPGALSARPAAWSRSERSASACRRGRFPKRHMSRAFPAAIHGTCVAHVSWDIESDPVLTGTRLIAEAWVAAGLYQVGSIGGDAGRSGTGGSAMTCVGS